MKWPLLFYSEGQVGQGSFPKRLVLDLPLLWPSGGNAAAPSQVWFCSPWAAPPPWPTVVLLGWESVLVSLVWKVRRLPFLPVSGTPHPCALGEDEKRFQFQLLTQSLLQTPVERGAGSGGGLRAVRCQAASFHLTLHRPWCQIRPFGSLSSALVCLGVLGVDVCQGFPILVALRVCVWGQR